MGVRAETKTSPVGDTSVEDGRAGEDPGSGRQSIVPIFENGLSDCTYRVSTEAGGATSDTRMTQGSSCLRQGRFGLLNAT